MVGLHQRIRIATKSDKIRRGSILGRQNCSGQSHDIHLRERAKGDDLVLDTGRIHHATTNIKTEKYEISKQTMASGLYDKITSNPHFSSKTCGPQHQT